MSNETSHDRLRVVVAGGGVAGLETVLALAERACELLDVTLVVNQHEFVFARGPPASRSGWAAPIVSRCATSRVTRARPSATDG
jgi:NADH dehydrogenase FAD-containing subunit